MQKLLENLEKATSFALIFLIPIFFLPNFQNPFELPKLLILIVGVVTLLLIRIASYLLAGRIIIKYSNLDLAVFLLAASYIASAVLKTPNKMDAFFFPGSATIVVSLALIYFLFNQQDVKSRKILSVSLILSGLALSLTSAVSQMGILKNAALPAFMKIQTFTPSGTITSTLIYLVVLVPLALSFFFSEKGLVKRAFWGVCLSVIGFGLALNLFPLLPGKNASIQLTPFPTSWAIAIDSVKDSPLFGVGPGNYLSAFTLYKPVSYNSTPFWSFRFTSGRNLYLTSLTEVGILGTIALGLLIINILKNIYVEFNKVENETRRPAKLQAISLLLTLILLGLFPSDIVTISLFFILMSITASTKELKLALVGGEDNRPGRVLSSIVLGTSLVGVFFLGTNVRRVVAGELLFKEAGDKIAANKPVDAYNLLAKATQVNPEVDRYRLLFARVNLAIAQAIALDLGDKANDDDRARIARLVQQAVTHGKASVALNQRRSGNWEVLGQIYQSIIPFAQGSDKFAISAYSQAIALDPMNPNLRVSLGGLYHSLGMYDEAIRSFELATFAKNDLANNHYNLAISLKAKGEIERSIQEMNKTISLLDPNSQDYQTAKKELENLEKNKPSKEEGKTGNETLTQPPSTPKPALKPIINLSGEASPPATNQ